MIVVAILVVAAAADVVAAVGDDATQDLRLLQVRCLLSYHCHSYPPRRSYVQDESTVL